MPFFFFGGFPIVFLFPFVFAIVVTILRTRAARRMAARAGLNEQDAAATAMLTGNGLDATYLAANLRPPMVLAGPASGAGSPPRTVEDRLTELDRLKQEGLITAAEYQSQRQTIVRGI